MATRFREEDWAATALGSSEAWPQSLKTAVELMLANPMVSTLAVGPELTLLFNDAAAPLYGALAEQALGRPLLETFPEGGASVRPLYERALAGESVTVRAMPLDTRGEGAATELFDAYLTPVRDEAGAVSAVFMTGFEISQHIAAERRLRESEERQTYLLELSDALSPLSEPEAIQHEAMRLLGEKLGVSRAQYYIADETGEYLSSSGGYTAGVPAAIGSFRLIEFGQYAYDGFHAGQTQVVSDARSDPRISKEVLRSYETVGFLAYIGVPFVQRGRLLGTIAVHQTGPRQWTDSERMLVEETAERAGIAVEQARAEQALRESEERYRSIFASMEDGFYFCEAIFDADGKCVDVLYHDENDAAIRMTGQSFKGKRLSELGAYEPYWYEILGDTAKTGTSHRNEMFAAPDQIWYEFQTFKPPAARENELAIVFHNVNDRRKLAEGEERYRTLFESIDEGFVVIELVRTADGRVLDYRIIEINPAFERQSGLLNAKGKLRSEIAPGNEDVWLDVYDEVARTGETKRFEDYHEPTDRWYDVFVARIEKTEPPRLSIVFSDITQRKQAETALRESEEKYRNLYTEMGQGYIEVELIRGPGGDAIDYRYLALNPAYERLTGIPIDKAVGRPSLEVIPDLSPFWAETFQRIVDNHTAEEFEYEEKALDRWYGIYAYPGDRDRLTVLALDITQRKKAEAALRESEEKYRSLFETMTEGFGEIEVVRDRGGRAVDFRYLELNPAWERLTGAAPSQALGQLVSDFMPGLDPFWLATWDRIARTGEPERFEHEAAPLGRWFGVYAYARGGDRVGVLYENITERKRTEQILRESEERKAFLLKLSDAVRPLAGAADIQGEATRLLREQLNAGWCYYVDWDLDKNTGVVLRDSAGEGLPSLAGAHDVSDAPDFLELLADGAVLTVRDYAGYDKLSSRIRQKFTQLGFRSMMVAPLVKEGRLIASLLVGDTEIRDWSAAESSLLVDVAERTWAAVERARVEVALRDNEERLRVLVGELQHRVRNILTVIRSIFSRTVEGDSSVEEVAEHFRGRLDALARTQVIMTQRVSGTVDLEQLIRDELLSVGAGPKGEITIKGPEIELTSKQAESIGLAIHELTTNSIKYGALSVDGAKLRITWKTEIENDRETLRLKWAENGVPIPHDPERRRGFGRELIEEGLPYRLGGSTRLELKDRGVECEIVVPLSAGRAGQSERRD